ncbi:MAG: nitrogen fixation protein [Nitrospirae bacterium]|nr:nitrogen fixation protein [Nitrospirota bacterium]
MKPESEIPPLCPSAQPEMAGSRILGVVGGSAEAPALAYCSESVPVTEELLNRTAPVSPTEVFRFSAHCEGGACRHFDGTHCRLATRVVQILPPVTETLPSCLIRSTCRWYLQEGKSSCLRCSQIVTQTFSPSEELRRAAES